MTPELPTLTEAGERIAAAADELFYRRGIRATGVDLIAETAGTTKKTIYDRFGSKDALVALYLQRRARRWQAFLESELAGRAAGVERIAGVFDAVEAWSRENTRGCAFVNAYAELGGDDHPGLAVVAAEKQWMRDCFTRLVAEGEIEDAERVATVVHLLYEGALVATFAGNDVTALAAAREAARVALFSQRATA